MDINQFRKHLARRQKLHEAPDYRIVSTNTLPLDSKINPNQDNIVVLLQWPDGTHTAGSGKTKEAAIQKAVEYHNHKPFTEATLTPALHEGVARKEHSTGTFHTIKAPGNRTLVFSDNELVGHIDFHEATPHVLPNSIDQHLVYVNGSYRDSRLKLQRPVFRKVGAFSSHSAALDALRAALANLRK